MKLGQPLAPCRLNDGVPTSFRADPNASQSFKINNSVKLKAAQQEEMMKRLHDLEVTKKEALEKKLAMKYLTDPLRSPRKKMTQEAMDEQVERVFKQAQVNHESRMKAVLGKYTTKEEHKKLTPEQMAESCDRMYTQTMEKKKVTMQRLKSKYRFEEPPRKKLTADDLGPLSARMYEEPVARRAEKLQALTDEYINNAQPWINGKVLTADQVDAITARLSTKG